MRSTTTVLLALVFVSAEAAPDFSGEWEIALCYDGEHKPCGSAHFSLLQYGSRICGDHMFITAGAGRMNEGDPGSVRGAVAGDAATLEVRSGRNDSRVRGMATLEGEDLHWHVLEELDPGNPIGDGLILGDGVLKRTSAEASDELRTACQPSS